MNKINKSIEQFSAARQVAVPLIAISTSDQLATQQAIAELESSDNTPLLSWDIVRNVSGMNKAGLLVTKTAQIQLTDQPPEAFDKLTQFVANQPTNGEAQTQAELVLVLLNAHRFLQNDMFVQALCNARDVFASRRACIVLLGSNFGDNVPQELATDILVIDEPLPTQEELDTILQELHNERYNKPASEQTRREVVKALAGLAAFPAKQAISLAVLKKELSTTDVWDRKVQMINATKGAKVYRGGLTFDDVAGLDNIKRYLTGILRGPASPNVILFFDEIEKGLNTGDDNSGVSQDQLGYLLNWSQETRAKGIMFFGVPGAGKSLVAKAAAAESKILCVQGDLGALKGGLVGESETNLRNFFKMVDAVGQGRVLMIATCNRDATLPPEFKRRFKNGTFFFDMPTPIEQAPLWDMYRKRFDVPETDTPTFDSSEWTGAEIEAVCENAFVLGSTLDEASEFIAPVRDIAQQEIARMREQAHHRYISASYAGKYDMNRNEAGQASSIKAMQTARKFRIGVDTNNN